MIEGCTDTVRILCNVRLQLQFFIKCLVAVPKIILQSLLGVSRNTVVGYIDSEITIGDTGSIVLLIRLLVDGLYPVLRELMDITVHLVMNICVLILELGRVDGLITGFLPFLLTLFCDLGVEFILLLELQTVGMLGCIITTLVCGYRLGIPHVRQFLVPGHGLFQIYGNYKLALISVLIDPGKTVLIDGTELHICSLDAALCGFFEKCDRLGEILCFQIHLRRLVRGFSVIGKIRVFLKVGCSLVEITLCLCILVCTGLVESAQDLQGLCSKILILLIHDTDISNLLEYFNRLRSVGVLHQIHRLIELKLHTALVGFRFSDIHDLVFNTAEKTHTTSSSARFYLKKNKMDKIHLILP